MLNRSSQLAFVKYIFTRVFKQPLKFENTYVEMYHNYSSKILLWLESLVDIEYILPSIHPRTVWELTAKKHISKPGQCICG